DGNVFHRQPFANADLGTGSDSIKRLLDRTLDLQAVPLDVGGDLDERQRRLQLALRLGVAPVLVERDRVVVVILLFARADGAGFLEGPDGAGEVARAVQTLRRPQRRGVRELRRVEEGAIERAGGGQVAAVHGAVGVGEGGLPGRTRRRLRLRGRRRLNHLRRRLRLR